MESEDLSRLRSALERKDIKRFVLPPGIHEVHRTISIERDDVEIGGVCNSDGRSILRRGHGFTGPLLKCVNQSDLHIHDLCIEGHRFLGKTPHLVDLRHPNDPDPRSPRFLPGRLLTECDEGNPAARTTPYEADILLQGTRRARLLRIEMDAPVRIGIAISRSAHDTTISCVKVRRAGEYGIWIGAAFPSANMILPLSEEDRSWLPAGIVISDSEVRDCGAAGVFIEGRDLSMSGCKLTGNHAEFPFEVEGGQVEVDYRSAGVLLHNCHITDGPSLERRHLDGRIEHLQTVGIEIYGAGVTMQDCRFERHPREALFMNGARNILVEGSGTFIGRNQTGAETRGALRETPLCDISITTTSKMIRRNALAGDISLRGITAERGVIVWRLAEDPHITIKNLAVVDCQFPLANHAVIVGHNPDGTSLLGEHSISRNVTGPKLHS